MTVLLPPAPLWGSRRAHPSALRDAPGRRSLPGVPRGLVELGLVAALYVAYSVTRLFADDSRGPAVGHARTLLHLERALGLDLEGALNQWFASVDVVGLLGSYWYATAHYVVTAAVLFWLHRRGAAAYLPARRALLVATLLALACYLLVPTAPPRFVGEFTDVLRLHADNGWWGADASAPRGLGGWTNQLAALPSLHAGWALWVALVVRRAARSRFVVVAGWGHAALTAVVVVGTGNHWVLDVAGGWTVVLLGWAACARRHRG